MRPARPYCATVLARLLGYAHLEDLEVGWLLLPNWTLSETRGPIIDPK